jgi:hypothetical protein
MNSPLALILFSISSIFSPQEISLQTMEKKAKEMIRVISLSDESAYRKFIKENYTEQLINKPMRRKVDSPDGSKATEDKAESNGEAKVKMYGMLHGDIGNGKILSMKRDGDKLTVDVSGDTGSSVTFVLTFLKTEPGLIDGFSVQMMMGK